MSSFLAVCILLIGHLFSSSATSLKTIKLASEESSQAQALTASPIGFSVTTLNSNITKLVNLNGYVYDVVYTDSLCSTFALAELQVLNICFRFSATKYKFITASSALVTYNTYTDAQCTLGGSNTIHVYESKVCSGQRRTFISETSNFIPTIAVGFQRWMNVWNIKKSSRIQSCFNSDHILSMSRSFVSSDITCSSMVTDAQYYALNECVSFINSSLKLTVSGMFTYVATINNSMQASFHLVKIFEWHLKVVSIVLSRLA